MEMNRDLFEKLSANNQQEESKKARNELSLINQWDYLEKKYSYYKWNYLGLYLLSLNYFQSHPFLIICLKFKNLIHFFNNLLKFIN